MTAALPAEAQIRRETMASIIANMLFSGLALMLAFGLQGPLRLAGPGGLALDFIPQFFMITLMSVLIPGWLTARKVAAGKVARLDASSRLPRRRFPRALLLAAIAGGIGALLALLLHLVAADATIGWWPALILKVAVGGLLAAIVTPLGLRAELAQQGKQ